MCRRHGIWVSQSISRADINNNNNNNIRMVFLFSTSRLLFVTVDESAFLYPSDCFLSLVYMAPPHMM